MGKRNHESPEVAELYKGVEAILDIRTKDGRKIGDCRYGVYLFIDYDGEPIYVGQTTERLRARIRRHLTNQRTDAIAMSVLDPFEVAEIEVWPFWNIKYDADDKVLKVANKLLMDRAEFTVYCKAIGESSFSAVLNEQEVKETDHIDLPESWRGSLLSATLRRQREHADIRIARRARTIANLARIISERKVKAGLRRALLVQARRLEHLAEVRLKEVSK